MNQLSFQYPAWYILFCILAGLLYAGILYYRDTVYQKQPPRVRRGLAVLRFLSVTIIAALLLSPLLRYMRNEVHKPVLYLALDNSASAGLGMKAADQQAFEAGWKQLQERFADQYEIVPVSFGQSVKDSTLFTHADKASDLAAPLELAYDRYSDQNLGAVVMASDGIFNEGSSPLYVADKLKVPVFTVGLGDTIPKKDVSIKRVLNNQIVYLGDQFTVQTDIGAYNCSGQAVSLNVGQVVDGKVTSLKSERIAFDNSPFFRTLSFQLPANSPGIQHYRISVSQLSGEVSYANNIQDFYVQVLDARLKVLLLAKSPHPDLGAIKYALEANKNYQVTNSMASQFKGDLKDFDFVVLHQLPDKGGDGAGNGLVNQVLASSVPRLFIVGAQTDLARFNQVQSLIKVSNGGQSANDVQAVFNPAFLSFTVSESLQKALPQFVPLKAPFGEYSIGANTQVFLKQKVGQISTDFPLLAFGDSGGTRTAVLCAEGLWQWKLFDYLQHQNFDLFGELISKTFQYTSTKADKRKFRAFSAKNLYLENDPVVLDAELYNDNFELVNEPEVALSIRNSKNQEFKFQFARQDRSYHLEAGLLPPDRYRFEARTTFAGKSLLAEGQFTIQALQKELSETTADHNLLRAVADQSGGGFFLPAQLSALGDSLQKLDSLKPVLYEQTLSDPALNLKWIFFLLFFLLSGEWFLRRYFGAY